MLKEGWLLKQSKKLKKWQKRYFVLDNVALYYCRSPTSVPDGFFAIRRPAPPPPPSRAAAPAPAPARTPASHWRATAALDRGAKARAGRRGGGGGVFR